MSTPEAGAQPRGLYPPPYPPPWQPPVTRVPLLDQALSDMDAVDAAPWGWRPVAIPLVTLVVLVVAETLAAHFIRPHTFGGKLGFSVTGNFVLEGLFAASVWVAGRGIAARYGGWATAFGWRRPEAKDCGYAAVGVVVSLVLDVAIGAVANAMSHNHAAKAAQNVELNTRSLAVVAVLVFFTVLCAPIVEELLFRGLLLRVFMRPMGFWPAALVSSAIFGAAHTYEVRTLSGAFTLAASVGAMGVVACVLVRMTDSLAPAIGLHASRNALAVAFLISQVPH